MLNHGLLPRYAHVFVCSLSTKSNQLVNVKPCCSTEHHSCGTYLLQSWALGWHQEKKTGTMTLKLLGISRHKASGHSHQTFTSSV